MRSKIASLTLDARDDQISQSLKVDPDNEPQHLFPVVDDARRLLGVVTRMDLQRHLSDGENGDGLGGIMRSSPAVAKPDEPLRVVVHRMAETGLTRFPVVSGEDRELVGMIALDDLLHARTLNLESERRRERVLRMTFGIPWLRRKWKEPLENEATELSE